MVKRKSITITDPNAISYFADMDRSEMSNTSFIVETFGDFKNKKTYNPYDLITIPPGKFGTEEKKNKNSFTTTLGLWVYNKVFIEPYLVDTIGYVNEVLNKKTMKKINQKIVYAVLENRIPLDAMKYYIQCCQKFQPYCDILAWSFTEGMLMSSGKINAKKKQLMKKYRKALDDKDPNGIGDMQKELLDYSEEILKDDPSMDMFDSGAKGSYGNNFKNIFVMRGAIKDPDPAKGYDVVLSDYIDGVKEDEYVTMARSLAYGPYSRAKKTQYGGYLEKLFLRSLQHVTLLPPGSDCGTKRTIEITLTKDIMSMCMYNWIVDGGKLVELTTENMDKYLDKTVHMRFASMCENPDGRICSKCIGNLFYRLGITNIGAAAPQVASRLKVIALKAFHDSQVKMHEIDVAAAFSDK